MRWGRVLTKKKKLDIDEVMLEIRSDEQNLSVYVDKCRVLVAENDRLRKDNAKIWRAVDSFEQIIVDSHRRAALKAKEG